MINITIYALTGNKDAFAREAEAEYAKRLSRAARIRHARLDRAPERTLWFDPTGEVLDSPGLARVIQEQLLTGNELRFGLGAPEMVVMVASLVLCHISFSTGRTNVLNGAAHMALFAAYLMTIFA